VSLPPGSCSREKERIAISIITFSEVYEGILRSPDPGQSERVFRTFVRGVTVLPSTRTVARRNAAIRLDLRRRGRTIRVRGLDLLIAATALT
jgi:predicted nucleic acid-binding protein